MTALLDPFTDAWAQALRETISNDETYRVDGANFETIIAFVLEAPATGDLAIELTLTEGVCSAATLVAPVDVSAPFVFRAPLDVWRALARDEIEPLTAIAQKRIAVTGSLTRLLMNQKAVRALLACAQRVPTRF